MARNSNDGKRSTPNRRATKQPAFLFFTGDWKKDPALGKCSPATRGIWIEALASMHDSDGCGWLSGTISELAQTCRCSTEAMLEAVRELRAKGAATVLRAGESSPLPGLPPGVPHWTSTMECAAEYATEAPSQRRDFGLSPADVVTLINRRMYRTYSIRKWAAHRQKEKYSRDKRRRSHVGDQSDSPSDLTTPSSFAFSIDRGSGDPLGSGAPSDQPSCPTLPNVDASLPGVPQAPRSVACDLGRASPKVMAIVDKHLDAALTVFRALTAARQRVRPRSSLKPSYDALAGIAARLDAGRTVKECLLVVAVYEAEVRSNPTAWRYFDAVSPWRPENFERTIARGDTLDVVATEDPATPSDRAAYPYRMPDGSPWPREIQRLVEELPPDAARRKIEFLRSAEPFRFDEQGNAKC